MYNKQIQNINDGKVYIKCNVTTAFPYSPLFPIFYCISIDPYFTRFYFQSNILVNNCVCKQLLKLKEVNVPIYWGQPVQITNQIIYFQFINLFQCHIKSSLREITILVIVMDLINPGFPKVMFQITFFNLMTFHGLIFHTLQLSKCTSDHVQINYQIVKKRKLLDIKKKDFSVC